MNDRSEAAQIESLGLVQLERETGLITWSTEDRERIWWLLEHVEGTKELPPTLLEYVIKYLDGVAQRPMVQVLSPGTTDSG